MRPSAAIARTPAFEAQRSQHGQEHGLAMSPLNSTTNLFYLVYQYMFESFNVGYSAAGALLIFLLLGLIIAAKMIWFEKLVHYS